MATSTRFLLWMSCFVLGIILAAHAQVQPAWWLWGIAGLVSLAGFRRKIAVAVAAGGLALGCLHVASWRTAIRPSWPIGQEVSITGTVVAPADRRPTKTLLTVLPDRGSGAKILVSAGRYPLIDYGDRVTIRGTVEEPAAFSGFDYPAYLAKDRILGTMTQPKQVRVIGHTGGNPILANLYKVRESLESTIQSSIPEPESGFLSGILLGSKRAVPEDLQHALQATGTSHIIAISGANITILLDILLGMLPLYTLQRQFWATAAVATFVCLLTGASASVVRGALVACLGRYAKLGSRKAWTLPLILFGMTLMLLESPLLVVADPGFQLSFAAFAGLGWLGPPCKRLVDRHLSRLPETVRGSLAETMAASLGTEPVSLALFGQLSLLGLVVNPLILWLLPAVTFMGLTLFLANWLPWIAAILQLPLWLCLHAILGIISWFGHLDIGLIHWQLSWAGSIGLWLAAGLLLIGIRKLPRHATA